MSEAKWVSTSGAIVALATVLLFAQSTPALSQEAVGARSSGCISCHEAMGGIYLKLVKDFKESNHWDKGLGCIDCHGGDPNVSDDVNAAMWGVEDFIGKPAREDIPEFCGRCHSDPEYMKKYGNLRTDQVALYKTSTHGIRLFEDGDTKVAVCSDCHTSHLVSSSSNPKSSTYQESIPETCSKCHSDEGLMSGYGISGTVISDYMDGRHGQLLFEEGETAAPVCTSCHGYHGATPPEIDSIQNVCGTCHLRTEQYYAMSIHNEAFKSLGLPKCITCHDNHKLERPSDISILSDKEGGCLFCHDVSDPAYGTIEGILASIEDIDAMYEEATDLVSRTEETTHLSMTEMGPRVDDIRTKLLTARILQHTTDLEKILSNQDEAREAFEDIHAFTHKLIDRGKSAKNTVLILGALLFVYGLFMLYYTKVVLGNK